MMRYDFQRNTVNQNSRVSNNSAPRLSDEGAGCCGGVKDLRGESPSAAVGAEHCE